MIDLGISEDWILEYVMKQMKEGYGEEGKETLRIIADYLEKDEKLPDDARFFLAKAFRDIHKGISPNRALMLNGRKKTATWQGEYNIAKEVQTYINSGLSVRAAVDARAQGNLEKGELAIGADKVTAAYYKFRDAVRVEAESWRD